eukprot:3841512-Pyramimonas_sp.AAC.1
MEEHRFQNVVLTLKPRTCLFKPLGYLHEWSAVLFKSWALAASPRAFVSNATVEQDRGLLVDS